jgi:cytochrome P450 family 6
MGKVVINNVLYRFTGERLGLMQSLAGIAAILSKFSIVPSKNSVRNPLIEPLSGPVQLFKGGLPVLLKHRKKNN